jgi:hypothetical protein
MTLLSHACSIQDDPIAVLLGHKDGHGPYVSMLYIRDVIGARVNKEDKIGEEGNRK